jgi:2-oxo-4-hydroxy-4-carboxy-5-ureidoimidazoline decarboxylase
MPISLAALNASDREAFVGVLGQLFEHSPWVADETYGKRPFASLGALHDALCSTMRAAPAGRQLELIRAHPDLAGRLAKAGQLTAASTKEQSAAGLDHLTPEEGAEIQTLNDAYKARFGFPFIICARLNAKATILAAMRSRVGNSADAEHSTALDEIAKIARLRLNEAVTADSHMPGKLSTHVLDLSSGRPASGMRIDLARLRPSPTALKSVVTNADGRTDTPLLTAADMAVGTYQLEFHVGEYFAAKGSPAKDAPFLDIVPVRFGISDPSASYHVPLLVTPWAYNTYRGS